MPKIWAKKGFGVPFLVMRHKFKALNSQALPQQKKHPASLKWCFWSRYGGTRAGKLSVVCIHGCGRAYLRTGLYLQSIERDRQREMVASMACIHTQSGI